MRLSQEKKGKFDLKTPSELYILVYSRIPDLISVTLEVTKRARPAKSQEVKADEAAKANKPVDYILQKKIDLRKKFTIDYKPLIADLSSMELYGGFEHRFFGRDAIAGKNFIRQNRRLVEGQDAKKSVEQKKHDFFLKSNRRIIEASLNRKLIRSEQREGKGEMIARQIGYKLEKLDRVVRHTDELMLKFRQFSWLVTAHYLLFWERLRIYKIKKKMQLMFNQLSAKRFKHLVVHLRSWVRRTYIAYGIDPDATGRLRKLNWAYIAQAVVLQSQLTRQTAVQGASRAVSQFLLKALIGVGFCFKVQTACARGRRCSWSEEDKDVLPAGHRAAEASLARGHQGLEDHAQARARRELCGHCLQCRRCPGEDFPVLRHRLVQCVPGVAVSHHRDKGIQLIGVLCDAVTAWEVERLVDKDFKYKLSGSETFHTSVLGDFKLYEKLKITKRFFRQGYLTKCSVQKKLHINVLQEATKLREIVYKHVLVCH